MSAATLAPFAGAHTAIPVVIDAGKVRRKQVRAVERGQVRLAGEVAEAIGEVRATLGAHADGKELVPVVIIYRRKRKRSGAFPLFPLLG